MRTEIVTEGARLLERYRELNGMQHQTLAAEIDVTPGQISHYIGGLSRPGLVKAFQIQDALGIPAQGWTVPARGHKHTVRRKPARRSKGVRGRQR